jgi:transcriptional regulator with XRE-family HTH domain
MALGIYARLGEEIRRRRERRGLSQAQLAERIGVGRTTVTMIEGGGQALAIHQLLEIAAALRADPISILKEVAEPSDVEDQTERLSQIEDLLGELATPLTRITR